MASEIVALSARVHTWRFGERPREIGTGSILRRDFVLVRVELADGTVGYGEAFHGHAGTAVAEIVNTTMQDVVVGRRCDEMLAVREETRERFLAASGMGGFVFALSGIDIAMWDAYGRSVGEPAWRLLGGIEPDAPAYAGGFTLGYSTPELLVADLVSLAERGYRAAKVRVGDGFEADAARVRAAREALGDDFRLMTDANLGLNYDTSRLATVLGEVGADWLEEPYVPGRRDAFEALAALRRVPLAAGENIFGADPFAEWIASGAIQVAQPDVSRVGGISEAIRVGHLAQAHGVRFVPHISHTALNHAATLTAMSAVGSKDFFEADPTAVNPFRQDVISGGVVVEDGRARMTDAPGLGVAVDEERLAEEFRGESGSPWPRVRR
ncbi:mandelate racemase/muconate lactonizing enzyme family protein [Microbacterium sp.]|uniref:mandelate racemase/muconate lactonizing enzyme family protein n=1 Tax=Microbacterium sp. TaxID=51671 RepID=UPI002B906727|nr:mandelate racemase/muconate lactonizing enzyme family protein [Microbacterium sp.]HWL77889.1 mandelate racemase/muconate lactonizing enzyme family protein [Microbacterium sp.]